MARAQSKDEAAPGRAAAAANTRRKAGIGMASNTTVPIPAPARMVAPQMTLATRWRRLRRQPAAHIVALFVVAQALCVVFGLIYPDDFRYVSATNVSLVLKAIPVIGIIALGVGVLMISGEFDLSVGSVYTLTAYAMALLYLAGMPLWAAVGATLLLGAAIGVVNGLITVRLAIPSFITTLGSMMVVRGLVRWLSDGRSSAFHPDDSFVKLMTGSVLGVNAEFVWFLGLTIAIGVMLHRTRLGNHMYLVGGSEKTAIAVGVNARLVKIVAFVFSSLGATLAGIISTTRVSTVTASQGIGFELKAITVCVIGGLFLSGGRGTVIGIFVGACLMYTVEDVLLLLRAPGFYIEVFIGVILVGAVIINAWLARKTR
jgi:ribose/xylose/arabinose/galactoside ABC-type transport system permease subunit